MFYLDSTCPFQTSPLWNTSFWRHFLRLLFGFLAGVYRGYQCCIERRNRPQVLSGFGTCALNSWMCMYWPQIGNDDKPSTSATSGGPRLDRWRWTRFVSIFIDLPTRLGVNLVYKNLESIYVHIHDIFSLRSHSISDSLTMYTQSISGLGIPFISRFLHRINVQFGHSLNPRLTY